MRGQHAPVRGGVLAGSQRFTPFATWHTSFGMKTARGYYSIVNFSDDIYQDFCPRDIGEATGAPWAASGTAHPMTASACKCRRRVCCAWPATATHLCRRRCEGAQPPVGAHGVRPLLTRPKSGPCRRARCHDSEQASGVSGQASTPPKSSPALYPETARWLLSATFERAHDSRPIPGHGPA